MENQQENTQATILQQPNGQKIYLDLTHSTDWVVAGSIFVSALISLIGFVITIYVVRKSTESQIQSNKDLIKSQNDLSMKNNKIEFLNIKYDDLKKAAIDYVSKSENYRMYMFILGQELRTFRFDESSEVDSFQRNIIIEMRSKLQQLLDAKALLRFSLYNSFEDSTLTSIVYHIHELDKKAFSIHASLIHNEKEKFDIELHNYQKDILDVEATLIEILKNKSILNGKDKPS